MRNDIYVKILTGIGALRNWLTIAILVGTSRKFRKPFSLTSSLYTIKVKSRVSVSIVKTPTGSSRCSGVIVLVNV